MSYTDEQDRVMELLLAEALRGEAPPDLTERILARAFAAPAVVVARPWWRRTGWAAAALVLLIAGLGLYLHGRARYPAPALSGDYSIVGGGPAVRGSEVVSGKGTALLTLGGYCQVELAPQTRLRITGSERAEGVYLVQGQLTCDIRHAVGGFTVETEIGVVRDTGTRFRTTLGEESNLSPAFEGDKPMTSRKLLVAVISGTVAVSGSWGETTLGAGQQSTFVAAASQQITGVVAEVSNGQLTLKAQAGSAKLAVTDKTAVMVNGKIGRVADLRIGMSAVAVSADGKTATEVRAFAATTPTTPVPKQPLAGLLTAVTNNALTIELSNGNVMVVPIDRETVVRIGNTVGTAADLRVGLRAVAIAQPGQTATEIRAHMPAVVAPPAGIPRISGTITQAGKKMITIQRSDGQNVVVSIGIGTVVMIDADVNIPANLKPGMQVTAVAQPGQQATEIRATSQAKNK